MIIIYNNIWLCEKGRYWLDTDDYITVYGSILDHNLTFSDMKCEVEYRSPVANHIIQSNVGPLNLSNQRFTIEFIQSKVHHWIYPIKGSPLIHPIKGWPLNLYNKKLCHWIYPIGEGPLNLSNQKRDHLMYPIKEWTIGFIQSKVGLEFIQSKEGLLNFIQSKVGPMNLSNKRSPI